MAEEKKVAAEKKTATKKAPAKKAAPKKEAAPKAEAPKAEAKKEAPKAAKKPIALPNEHDYKVILEPVITEKSMALLQNENKVTVKVADWSNKDEIKLSFPKSLISRSSTSTPRRNPAADVTKASSAATRKRSSPSPKARLSTSSKSRKHP